MIEGAGQVEEGLEQAVEVGRLKEILPPDDVRDPLQGVIDDDGEMVAGADVLAHEHGIPEPLRVGDLLALVGILPPQGGVDFSEGLAQIETQGVGLSRGDALGAFGRGKSAADSRIERAIDAMRGLAGALDFPQDILAGAKAGVEQLSLHQLARYFLVIGEV